MLPYVLDVDANRIHVQAPTDVVFLCGGQVSSISLPIPLSMRDAFLKIINNPAIADRTLILAEDVTREESFKSSYKDLLEFETDLAQITELILLFCESEGSLAELGAFAMIREIASRMMVVVRDKHWEQNSFIRLGPLKSLVNNHGKSAVFVIDDADIGIDGNNYGRISISILKDRLQEPLVRRLEKTREPTTFDRTRSGHLIKLIVGLIQDYGGLMITEVHDLMAAIHIELSEERIAAYLVCAQAVEWIELKRKGSDDIYFARKVGDAATLPITGGAEKNKARRRILIREYWKIKDPLRYRGITEVFGVPSGE